MDRRRLSRYLPSPAQVRENPALRPVAHLLSNPEIWHFNRRSVAGAVFIGLFCAFVPIPAQMVLAAFMAVVGRCNLPISVALVWITNPITIAPMFYFAYRLGGWLLNMQISMEAFEPSPSWLWENLGTIGYPLLFGSFVCGWVSGVTGFVLTRIVWRWHVIARWRERRARLRARKQNPGA